MVNKCVVCSELFPQWSTYAVHMEAIHDHKIDGMVRPPLTKEEKAAIVAKGEQRLGDRNFLGGK